MEAIVAALPQKVGSWELEHPRHIVLVVPWQARRKRMRQGVGPAVLTLRNREVLLARKMSFSL